MTARELLRQLLVANLTPTPATAVLKHPTQVDPPAVRTVMLKLTNVAPGQTGGMRAYTFGLVLLSTTPDVDGSDLELEQLVEDVLEAIEDGAGGLAVTWAEGKRGTYRSTMQAFEIPVTVHVAVTQSP